MFSEKTLRSAQCGALVILILTGYSNQCGPGPKPSGSSKVRRKQNLSPLVYKQHVPNISENTFGASGLPDGSISRTDPRFKDLVENHNTKIIFRDEERDGSDRFMTKRCKEKLDILAIMVENEWPGNPPEEPPVKVKVKEAWDDTYLHGDNSLHYEGRAVDVATNDRDRSKLGTLARLAQAAGFDWVFYESHGHIHCSVKSESSVAIKTGGCFSNDGTVQVENLGTIAISDLRVGDRVLSMGTSGALEYSDVISFMDRDDDGFGLFHTFHTASGRHLTLTGKHLVYVIKQNSSYNVNDVEVVFAEEVRRGQYLLLRDKDSVTATEIKDISIATKRGIYAPLTKHGTIVVDGIVASCYAYINNIALAHSAFAPIRAYYDISQYLLTFSSQPEAETSPLYRNSTDLPVGMHWYARTLYNVGTKLFSKDTLFVH